MAALWGSRCGHEDRDLDHEIPTFRDLDGGPAMIG
jgi:hypothetical protein